MRNIKDLKPNEAIKISTKKDARKFNKMTDMKVRIGDIISFSDNCWFFADIESVVYPASEFLPKKSKLKKAVSNLKARVKVLEKGSDFTQEINNIETEALLLEPTQPLTELPEKWHLAINSENKEVLQKWIGTHLNRALYVHEDVSWSGLEGFDKNESIEISTEDFKRLVLKENVLEVGKWYKDVKNSYLIYIASINDKNAMVYGFSMDGKWIGAGKALIKLMHDLVLATPKEIETALINEAKKRGYNPLSKIIDVYDNETEILGQENIFYQHDRLWYNSECCLFNNGIWAEIIDPAKEEIDWSKPGQLVSHEQYNRIIYTDGNHSEKTFKGTLIVTDGSFKLGYDVDWGKHHYKLYTGQPITLSN